MGYVWTQLMDIKTLTSTATQKNLSESFDSLSHSGSVHGQNDSKMCEK